MAIKKRRLGEGFIVRLDQAGNFFTRLIDGRPFGTAYPSYAQHASYEVADEVCQRVKAIGYVFAMVCDRFGTPVDVAALEHTKAVNESDIKRFWGESAE